MDIHILSNPSELGTSAAQWAENILVETLATQGFAHLILATGASQFEMLKSLTASKKIDWSKVTMFHLDEYIGISSQHPASFRKYLKKRFIDKVPTLGGYHLIDGENDPQQECERLNTLIKRFSIDLAMIGIGENGHLAFNDPPADFETRDPYIVVKLDEACRLQQVGEGWFHSIEQVPQHAISMSIRHILSSKKIICSVPDARKAPAVQQALEGDVDPMCPASVLKDHPSCHLFLDRGSSHMLSS